MILQREITSLDFECDHGCHRYHGLSGGTYQRVEKGVRPVAANHFLRQKLSVAPSQTPFSGTSACIREFRVIRGSPGLEKVGVVVRSFLNRAGRERMGSSPVGVSGNGTMDLALNQSIARKSLCSKDLRRYVDPLGVETGTSKSCITTACWRHNDDAK